ncbi:MAG: inositol monophosphatase [Candidatus Magasanikbacteria bacterium]|nr:inositol monophosphatase [Candidatus Magasanikbacteria bacterium]
MPRRSTSIIRPHSRFGRIALKALDLGSAVVRKHYGQVHHIQAKGGNPKDLVTETDFASERAILDTITRAFPDHGVFSEEQGKSGMEQEYIWVVDPLDGTTNFTRDIPCISVSIALTRRGRTIVAAVANPLSNEIFFAERGLGAFLNGIPIHVSRQASLADAFVCSEWYSRTPQFARHGLKIFSKLATVAPKIRYLSGTVWSLTRVARGLIDVETCDTSYLDVAAMSLIINEAGGKLTDEYGRSLKMNDTSVTRIVAANPNLHREVRQLIRRIR